MAKLATELQISLAVNAWQLTDRRAALLAELAEIDELHRQAIALAATYGVPQKSLAALCDVSGPRISKIVSTTVLPAASIEAFNRTVTELLERPQDLVHHPVRKDTPAWDRKFAISRGHDPKKTSHQPV